MNIEFPDLNKYILKSNLIQNFELLTLQEEEVTLETSLMKLKQIQRIPFPLKASDLGECSICYDLTEVFVVKCPHLYCLDCLEKTMEQQRVD